VSPSISPSASPSVPPAQLEQEGYRWRNDNGNETTATWIASQDTNVSIHKEENIRIRFIINATDDVASKQFNLQYKLASTEFWTNVGVV